MVRKVFWFPNVSIISLFASLAFSHTGSTHSLLICYCVVKRERLCWVSFVANRSPRNGSMA
jgi:hypothetical protein